MIWDYYRKAGREMPWRETRDPYAIFISEVMLQQTQVDRVRPKYEAWLATFPTWETLASAPVSKVLTAWQGLGYNRRALALKRAAEMVVSLHGGTLPKDRQALDDLPGIGAATAGSLSAFCFNLPEIFIETNIRRVYIHFFFPKKADVTDAQIEKLLALSVDQKNPREWYYALMDYGAYLSKTTVNANKRSKHYAVQSRFEGSRREVRGAILREVLKRPQETDALYHTLPFSKERIDEVIRLLTEEGFLVCKNNLVLPS